MWNKPNHKRCDVHVSRRRLRISEWTLLLLMPLLSVLMSLAGNERLAQFLLLMTGPMVVLALTTNPRDEP
ncbi:MAG TPA: hypothetical protein VFV64_08115 [Permianibacter sp.]|nr:hypothetical protein [Permianibacter sp.]